MIGIHSVNVLRNQQGNVRLLDLALVTIHRNIPLNVEEIVNMFI